MDSGSQAEGTALATVMSPHGHPLPAGYLHTSGARIVDGEGNTVRLAGANWYGFECSSMVAGGLDHQSVDSICETTANLGFNVIRLPFCLEMVLGNPVITQYVSANPELVGLTALQIMDTVINTAGRHGLKVILDSHRAEAGWSAQSNGLWYTRTYPEVAWLNAWSTLTNRYKDASYLQDPSYVIGCDLHNEPGSPPLDATAWPQNNGATWGYNDTRHNTATYPGDWSAAARRAGNAILAINPNLLIIVEGVRWDPAGPIFDGSHPLFWPGGNLMGVGHAAGQRKTPVPITLDLPNRLVYSVHDYGPDMYSGLAWCQVNGDGSGTGATPAACNNVWDQAWGYIVKNGVAPILVGEFGTVNGYKPNDTTPPDDYTDINSNHVAQGYWFTYLVDYIRANGLNWTYWALNGTQSLAPGRNPSTPEWYGVLNPNWDSFASAPMMDKLHVIQ